MKEHKQTLKRTKVKDIASLMEPRHLKALRDNDKLAACCRKPEDHEVEMFQTEEGVEGQDLAIFHCTCGRRHFRIAVSGKKG